MLSQKKRKSFFKKINFFEKALFKKTQLTSSENVDQNNFV